MTVTVMNTSQVGAASTPIATLRLGAQQTSVSVQGEGGHVDPVTLAVGVQQLATDYFRHVPPTPLEIENAIVAVEDEIMRVHERVRGGAVLQTDDAAIRALARAAGLADAPILHLSLEAVEHQFDLLAARVQGRPASSAGIPTDASFAATLLILREFMHHLGFASIRISPDLGPIRQGATPAHAHNQKDQ